MNINKHITRFILTAALVLPGMANAAVTLPALGFQDLSAGATEDGLDDAGAILTSTNFSIDATVHEIVTSDPLNPIDIANQSFTLNAELASGLFGGSFTVGGGLLTGSFADLLIIDIGAGMTQFSGDVSYTGGSLMVSPPSGRIEGTIFSDGTAIGKVGAVVPVPAAVWLFGSGILGLVAVARRKKTDA